MDNPPESSRTYSSIWSGDAIGTGHAQSMINSAQAWSAQHNQVDEWMQMDLGSTKYVTGVQTQQRATGDNQRVTMKFLGMLKYLACNKTLQFLV